MHLSRFVVAYRDVRPGEHVLYNVLTDHYIGIDGATFDAVGMTRQSTPSNMRTARRRMRRRHCCARR